MTRMKAPITAEELARRGDALGRCELIKGEVVQIAPTFGEHGETTINITFHLTDHVKRNKLGKVYAAETGFLLARHPDTVRAPDVAFITQDRLPPPPRREFMSVAPDLVAEVVSSGDRAGEVVEKVQQWLTFGCPLVWVADPRSRTVTAYRPDGWARVHHDQETLDAGRVVPGFTLPVAEVFA